jgi:hypothetical protein
MAAEEITYVVSPKLTANLWLAVARTFYNCKNSVMKALLWVLTKALRPTWCWKSVPDPGLSLGESNGAFRV